jgi:hypothetical protein
LLIRCFKINHVLVFPLKRSSKNEGPNFKIRSGLCFSTSKLRDAWTKSGYHQKLPLLVKLKIYSFSSRNRKWRCWARIFGIVELNLLRCGVLPNTGAEWPDFPKRRSRCSCWCPHQYLAGKGYLPSHLWMLHSRCKYDSNKAKYLKQRIITTGKWSTLWVELIGFTLICNNPILTKMMQ